jgi:hypothetical protein
LARLDKLRFGGEVLNCMRIAIEPRVKLGVNRADRIFDPCTPHKFARGRFRAAGG